LHDLVDASTDGPLQLLDEIRGARQHTRAGRAGRNLHGQYVTPRTAGPCRPPAPAFATGRPR
jgi:hypothetical protein